MPEVETKVLFSELGAAADSPFGAGLCFDTDTRMVRRFLLERLSPADALNAIASIAPTVEASNQPFGWEPIRC